MCKMQETPNPGGVADPALQKKAMMGALAR
jgi:hypothetical protein